MDLPPPGDTSSPSGDTAPLLPAPPRVPRTLPVWARVLLYLLAWFVVFLMAQVAALIVGAAVLLATGQGLETLQAATGLPGANSPPAAFLLFGGMQFAALAGTVGVTWLFVRFLDREPFAAIGFSPVRRQWLHWLAGTLLGGLFVTTLLLCGAALGWYEIVGFRASGSSVVVILGALAIMLPAAAVEEITMRGYVLRVITQKHGAVWGLFVSSLVFALLHGANPGFRASPGAVLGLLLAGIYLGVPYLLTGRLFLPIALHTAWNLFEGPVFGFKVSGITTPSIMRLAEQGPTLWTGGAFGPEAGLLLPILMVVHLPLLIWVARRLPRDIAQTVSEGQAVTRA